MRVQLRSDSRMSDLLKVSVISILMTSTSIMIGSNLF